MVSIITDNLVEKIYKITGDNVQGDFFVKETELWYGIKIKGKKAYFHKELLELFSSQESAIKMGEALGELFSGEYIGVVNDD